MCPRKCEVSAMTKLKKRSLKKSLVVDFATYMGVTVIFVVM